MKLQGVNILRVTDFRRFFELAEFWMRREEFTKLANSFLASQFCDNEEEQCLFDAVKNWCAEHTVMAELKEQELILQDGIKDCKHFFLGRLAPAIATERNQLGPKDLIGLTALYLLLGADKKGSDIPLQYSMLATLQTRNVVGEFMPVFDNCVLKATNIFEPPLKRCVIVNMQAVPIAVKAESRVVTLNSEECVVGLFCGNACYKLLPNMVTDFSSSQRMRLLINTATHRPYLKISNREIIEDVASIWLEPGAGVACTTFDGQVHFNEEYCYSLKRRIDSFRKNRPGEMLLAIEVNEAGNYTLYSENHISY